MKRLNRILSLALAAMMALTLLTGCGGGKVTFSESAPNAATIISKVFFSIDTISIFMQLSVCPQR